MKTKMKLLFFICLLGSCFVTDAQTGVFNQVQVNNLRIKGKTVNGVSNDSTLAGNDSTKLTTEFAVKNAIKKAVPDTSQFLKKGFKFPIGVTWPIIVKDSSTIGFDPFGIIRKVSMLTDLINDTSTATMLMLTDPIQGGLFMYSTLANTIDSGIVLPATGKGSGYWIRQYDKTKGVNVDWWGNDSYAIVKAVNAAGVNGIINFSPNKTYLQYDAIIAQDGQTFNGNNATLKRAPEAANITTLSQAGQLTDSIITVSSVPALWKVGDQVQIYQDSTAAGAIMYTRWILAISGNSVSLSSKIGGNPGGYDQVGGHPAVTVWPIGTKVRKVFSQITTATVPSSLTDVMPTNFIIRDLIVDGNNAGNGGNHSWYANAAVYGRGYNSGILIENCTFMNMPNDCIEGHGFRVINNLAFNLASSFVHLTAINVPGMKSQIHSIVENNIVDGVNQLSNFPNTGHSAGAITNSFTSGYVSVQNNRFLHGGESVFGNPENSLSSNNLSVREVIMTGNYFKGFKNISSPTYWGFGNYGFPRMGHIYIAGNVFDSCGVNDWTPWKDSLSLAVDTIMIGNNLLVGGTVWKIPVLKSDTLQRYVLNNPYITAQPATINITGKGSFGDTVKVNNPAIATQLIATGSNTGTLAGLWVKGVRPNSRFELVDSTVGGGFASNIMEYLVTNRTNNTTSLASIGVNGNVRLGSTPTVTYMYIGVGSDATFLNNNVQYYPDKTVGLMNVNDAVGDFVTRNSSGLITRRTAAETQSDIGFTKGTATLSAGTVTVSSTAVTASSKIFVTVNTPGGTQGFLSVPTASIVAGSSFVINSSSATETSTVNWLIVN